VVFDQLPAGVSVAPCKYLLAARWLHSAPAGASGTSPRRSTWPQLPPAEPGCPSCPGRARLPGLPPKPDREKQRLFAGSRSAIPPTSA